MLDQELDLTIANLSILDQCKTDEFQRLDEQPVLYKIYSGKVVHVEDFGAFIILDGVTGQVESASK
jgi:ribosomal protein S1